MRSFVAIFKITLYHLTSCINIIHYRDMECNYYTVPIGYCSLYHFSSEYNITRLFYYEFISLSLGALRGMCVTSFQLNRKPISIFSRFAESVLIKIDMTDFKYILYENFKSVSSISNISIIAEVL